MRITAGGSETLVWMPTYSRDVPRRSREDKMEKAWLSNEVRGMKKRRGRRCRTFSFRRVLGGWSAFIIITVLLCRLGSAVGAWAVPPSSQADFPTAPDYPDNGFGCRMMPGLRQSIYYGDWVIWGRVTGCGDEISYKYDIGMKLRKAFPVQIEVLECFKGTNPGRRITVWIDSREREYLPEFHRGQEFVLWLNQFFPRDGYELSLGAEGLHYVSRDRRLYPVNPHINLAPTVGISIWEFRGIARRSNVAKIHVAYDVWSWKRQEQYQELQ